MIGLPTGETSGIFVVDLDVDKQSGVRVGENTLRSIGLEPDFAHGLQVRTPSGGCHGYFRHPGSGFHNSNKKIGVGVDTRGDGGYVIAPGSITGNGGRYVWTSRTLFEIDSSELPTLPFSIRSLLASGSRPKNQHRRVYANSETAEHAVKLELLAIQTAPEGTRNETLFRPALAVTEIVDTGIIDKEAAELQLIAAAKAAGLDEREAKGTIKSAQKTVAEGASGLVEVTQDAAARLFVKRNAATARYDTTAFGAWLTWRGDHWRQDKAGSVLEKIRLIAREISELETPGRQAQTRKASFVSGAELFARRDPAVVLERDAWDSDPLLLGCPGVTVDLRTGAARAPLVSDMITNRTAVAPAATVDCPVFLRFLDETTGSDAGFVRFLQQIAGYCLIGDTREHAFFFLYGLGGNGKSVFLNTVCGVLGEYATTAAMDTFTASKHERHPTELAMLRGARLVTATETEEGRRWAESLIKSLTGGDPISDRFMRQDFFTFRPVFKLLFAGNHKPTLRIVDEASRRRFNIFPFTRQPSNPDPHLEIRLKAEWPGILRWLIDGALDWQRHGLIHPAVVTDETAEYFDSQDSFGQCLEDRCVWKPNDLHA